MTLNCRKKEEFEAFEWFGEEKEELKDFVGEENLEWKFYTNHAPIPFIKGTDSGEKIKVDVFPYFIVKEGDEKIKIYTKAEFDDLFERI